MRTWTRIKHFPDGLSYFKCAEFPARVYVGDASGNTPDACDDGALYLTGELSADWKNVSAAVVNERGNASTTLLGFDEALWVSYYTGARINTKYGAYLALTPERLEELNQR